MSSISGNQPPMRILITNDDGIEAPGIRWLARAVAHEGYDVVVAAPLSESSGSSAAMTAVVHEGKIVSEPRELHGAKHIPAYGVAASPAYIVLLALREAFGPVPDLVVSGINRGANAGAAVVHSGTVGATLTASHAGLRGLAVSLDVLTPAAASASSGGAAIAALDTIDDELHHWASGAAVAVRILPALLHTPPGTVFNLNVPDLHLDGIRGLRQAHLARFGQVQMSIAEAGEGFVRTAVQAAEEELEAGSDLAALAENFAVVTPIRAPHEDTDIRINVEAVRVQSPGF
ncbi:5'/3'-nucleotidase SurE [Actinoplanes sp. CA-015351]|uniref:5'-nucleotidase n=1 Tax=Actinoplanes lutulentus TaxID=1287878 RepID=A0A327ZG47_9ACTN|nr:5'/3'-nucleotidase SurE [Actinoplanes lutulentus]MBB2941876.1 5'-nucleotidase [Actinoplanes lutulentus]RAK39793.1 5'-nucleotidase [Actinoplanes lutulentus]